MSLFLIIWFISAFIVAILHPQMKRQRERWWGKADEDSWFGYPQTILLAPFVVWAHMAMMVCDWAKGPKLEETQWPEDITLQEAAMNLIQPIKEETPEPIENRWEILDL